MRKLTIILLLSALCMALTGCGDDFWDPTQIGRFRPVPAVNLILDSLGVADETPSTWENAEEPKPIDVMSYEADQVLGPGDFVRVSIFELFQEGIPLETVFIVTESGKISIPEVGVIDAEGLTETELEERIKDILTPGILKDPSVSVTLTGSQRRTFSISGQGVPLSGRYEIPRYDYRLTDALAEARVSTQINISYIYVTRNITGEEEIAEPESVEPAETEPLIEYEPEMLEIIAPRAQRQNLENQLIITSAEMATDDQLSEIALPEGFNSDALIETQGEPAIRETIDEPIDQQDQSRIEWVFQDGRWVPIQIGSQEPSPKARQQEARLEDTSEPLESKVPEQFDWSQVAGGAPKTRLIKIPTDKLSAGDPRYNILIRPGDNIQVPIDVIGAFWIEGNVNFQGRIDFSGQPMTLKQAIAAAGGLGPLAWPKRCEVVRRIGRNKEEIVMVNLDKIASGEQPDFFVKQNDLINVGTHPTARWRAVVRNAFRATYGFGFIYDRNFADRDFGTARPFPEF